MSRKACRRKVRPVCLDPVTLAIQGASFTPEDKLNQLRMFELGQIDAIAKGVGTLTDLRYITDLINVCETMASMGIGPEAMQACVAAEQALLGIMKRFEKWKKLEATADQVEAFREVFRFHDAQRCAVTRGEYERAIQKTVDRIRSAHPSVKVIA